MKLLSVFDSIYILDLRGNARKKEEDENIFGNSAGGKYQYICPTQKNHLGDIYISDIRGTALKTTVSFNSGMKNIDWTSVQHSENTTKMFLFRPIATSKSYEYTGFPLEEFFRYILSACYQK